MTVNTTIQCYENLKSSCPEIPFASKPPAEVDGRKADESVFLCPKLQIPRILSDGRCIGRSSLELGDFS
jgi:hypothetical protein